MSGVMRERLRQAARVVLRFRGNSPNPHCMFAGLLACAHGGGTVSVHYSQRLRVHHDCASVHCITVNVLQGMKPVMRVHTALFSNECDSLQH